jgi:selenoprotein W-related protein
VAAEIVGEFRAQPELIRGSGGVFIVTQDGKEIFNKKQTGRFPDEGEITEIVKAGKVKAK